MSKIQPYHVHVNLLGIMNTVLLNLTTLLMSNNITNKYTIVTIENHFETYSTLEQIIIKAATKKDYLQELNEVVSFYGLDLNFKLNLSYLDK